MITGRTSRIAHASTHRWTPLVFVLALVVAFFALAPSAAACTHDIVIHKVETGVLAPGGTYEIRVTGVRFDRTVSVTAGGTATIAGVAPGVYEFDEVGHPDAVIDPNPLLVTNDGSNGDVVDVFVTNDVPGARLSIAKVETGSAAPHGTYTFDVTGPVALTATVTAGTTWTSDWLPLGTYTITERDAPAGHTITPNPVTLDTDGQTVTVTATNPYRDQHARLAINKVETGTAAPHGTYTFDVTGPVALTATVTASTTWTSDWLPLGTYTITERDAPGIHSITPNPVTLDTDGQTVTVTASNHFRDRHAYIAITKVETGTAAPHGTYTFDIVGPVTRTATIPAGFTWTSDHLPLGTYTITERNAPAGHTITPNPVTLDTDEQTVTVRATNPYRDQHARLAIAKIETGSAAPGGTHIFDITGPGDDPVTLTATVTAGTTWTSDWLPLGTYTITERNAPVGHTITPNPVTLDTDEQTVTVTATNPYLGARLAIQKVQAGVTGVGATYTFEVHGPVTFNVQVAAGTTWTSELLPLGTYTVTERNAPAGHTIVPAAAVLSTDGSTVTVVATNPAVLSESSPPVRLPATGAAIDELALLAGFLVATGGLLAATGHRRRRST